MFCTLYKWLISQAVDSGKPVSGLVRRHLRGCAACREYAQFSQSINQRSAQDIGDILKAHDGALDEKIISGLSKAPESRTPSARKPVLIPAVAAASALFIIAISIILLTIPKSSPFDPLKAIYEFDISQASLEKKIETIESPLEEEFQGLKQSLNSTAKFLISCLEQGIGDIPY